MHKKWTVQKKKLYRNIQLPGVFASFPGAREISSISGSLPDDPGGITCMRVCQDLLQMEITRMLTKVILRLILSAGLRLLCSAFSDKIYFCIMSVV